MYIGRKKYIGRNKDQGTTGTCARQALTALMTTMYWDMFKVLKEFSVESIGLNRFPEHPKGYGLAQIYCLDIIRKNGVSEEGKELVAESSLEHRMNLKSKIIKYRDELEYAINRGGYIIGNIQGLDKETKEGHAMFLLGIDNLKPPFTICDFVFQNSWGQGQYRMNNVDINAMLVQHTFEEVYLAEDYIRQEWTLNSKDYFVNGVKKKSDLAPFLQPVKGEYPRTVIPIRAISEATGNLVVYENGKILIVNKPQEI